MSHYTFEKKSCRCLPTAELCEIRSVPDPGRGGIYVAHKTSRAHLDQDTKIPRGHHPFLEFLQAQTRLGKQERAQTGAAQRNRTQVTFANDTAYWCHFVCTQIVRLSLRSGEAWRSRTGRVELSTMDQFSTVCGVIMACGQRSGKSSPTVLRGNSFC